jgi:16S rRNA (guanine527-N7)-methyltransferase
LSLTSKAIQETLQKAGLAESFPPDSFDSLTRFCLKLLQINETLNLTKWTEEEDFLRFHLLDSAYALPELKPLIAGPQQWIDLGTGGGFPGAILIAAFPQVEVTLLDSVGKKIKALEECLQAAGWKAKTLIGRAEDIGQGPHRESWNGVTTRAVADFRVVLEYGIPFLKTGGYLVNWITEDQLKIVDKSKNALKQLHSKIIKKADYSLPGLSQRRSIVIVEKLGKTPITYPRPVGQASKKPL